MLELTKWTSRKTKEGSLEYHNEIPAVYFEYAPGDDVEEKKNRINYKDANGVEQVSEKSYKAPVFNDEDGALKVSKVDPKILFSETVERLQSEFPDQDGLWTLLRFATDGYQAWTKMQLTPKPEISEAAAIEQLANKLVKVSKKPITIEQARVKARLMLED